MNALKISIVTINFNAAASLERTILSVLRQTRLPDEYIIIDGSSTDNSVEIIKKYTDKITHWVSEKDRGISDAFNKGIALATGDIIGIINSDDWYEPNALEVLEKFHHMHPTAEIYHGGLLMWDNSRRDMYLEPGLNPEQIKREMIFNHPSTFVKRETYQRLGNFDLQYKYAMDYDLLLRFFVRGARFAAIAQHLANMNMDGRSGKNWILTHREVCRTQIHHLGQAWFYRLLYLLRITRTGTRQLLTLIGLGTFVRLWRSLQKNKKYLDRL